VNASHLQPRTILQLSQLEGQNHPLLDLSTPATYHLNAHISPILHITPTSPAMHFQRPGDTRVLRSKPHPPPDLFTQASQGLKYRTHPTPPTLSSCRTMHFHVPGHYECVGLVSAFRGQNTYTCPISSSSSYTPHDHLSHVTTRVPHTSPVGLHHPTPISSA
jgi:hypothetical protein